MDIKTEVEKAFGIIQVYSGIHPKLFSELKLEPLYKAWEEKKKNLYTFLLDLQHVQRQKIMTELGLTSLEDIRKGCAIIDIMFRKFDIHMCGNDPHIFNIWNKHGNLATFIECLGQETRDNIKDWAVKNITVAEINSAYSQGKIPHFYHQLPVPVSKQAVPHPSPSKTPGIVYTQPTDGSAKIRSLAELQRILGD
jgi:hypothetical protein